jgi:hypothetical protein
MRAVRLRNGTEGSVGIGNVDLIGVGIGANIAEAEIVTGVI